MKVSSALGCEHGTALCTLTVIARRCLLSQLLAGRQKLFLVNYSILTRHRSVARHAQLLPHQVNIQPIKLGVLGAYGRQLELHGAALDLGQSLI